MRYQHSFWYRESKELFEQVLKADPECGIAYWGVALSLLNNPHAPPPVANLPLGLAAVEKGKAVGAKTPARARLHQRDGRVLHRLRQDPIIAAAYWPISRPWKAWRGLTRTTTKRRSSMRSA